MAKVYDEISQELAQWLQAQPVFVVGTAPTGDDGHINISPKGGTDTFAVLGPNRVAYLDITGSGIETIAHLRANGRIVLMFMSFDKKANIVRLHGRGSYAVSGSSEYADLATYFPQHLGARAVIVVEVSRISDSCGWGVPRMELVSDRIELLDKWAEKKGLDGIADYQLEHNSRSIDGLPGLG